MGETVIVCGNSGSGDCGSVPTERGVSDDDDIIPKTVLLYGFHCCPLIQPWNCFFAHKFSSIALKNFHPKFPTANFHQTEPNTDKTHQLHRYHVKSCKTQASNLSVPHASIAVLNSSSSENFHHHIPFPISPTVPMPYQNHLLVFIISNDSPLPFKNSNSKLPSSRAHHHPKHVHQPHRPSSSSQKFPSSKIFPKPCTCFQPLEVLATHQIMCQPFLIRCP